MQKRDRTYLKETWCQDHRRNPLGKCMFIVINKNTKNTSVFIGKNTGLFIKKNNGFFKNWDSIFFIFILAKFGACWLLACLFIGSYDHMFPCSEKFNIFSMMSLTQHMNRWYCMFSSPLPSDSNPTPWYCFWFSAWNFLFVWNLVLLYQATIMKNR